MWAEVAPYVAQGHWLGSLVPLPGSDLVVVDVVLGVGNDAVGLNVLDQRLHLRWRTGEEQHEERERKTQEKAKWPSKRQTVEGQAT